MKVNHCFEFVFPALLAVVLVVSTPRVLLGGLADIAKAKAAETLTNTVMKEIEKKIADAVEKKPISETDKANITKRLTNIARHVVKKSIDGAVSGKLPSPAELVNTVMKDILPQVDGLVAEIIKRNQSVAVSPSPPPSPPPLAPPTTPSAKQWVAAVYVTGGIDIDAKVKDSVGAGILNALADGKDYIAVKNGEGFLAEVGALRSVQIGNTVYDDQISEIGAKFGVDRVCVVEITPTSEAVHVLTRMIDVKTAEVVSVGNAFGSLKSDGDIAVVSGELVKKMAGLRAELKPNRDSNQAQNQKQPEDINVSLNQGQNQYQNQGQNQYWNQNQNQGQEQYRNQYPNQSQDLYRDQDRNQDRNHDHKWKSMSGVSLGYGLSQDAESRADFLQLGFVHSRPISETAMSFDIEGNFWVGVGKYRYRYYDGSDYNYAHSSFNFFSADVPLTVLYQLSVFSFEAGLHGNVLFGDSELLFDAGFVAGVGIVFDKKRVWRCFYRYNSGFNYGTHVFGMWRLF